MRDEDQQSQTVSVPRATMMLPPAEQYRSLARTLLHEIAAHRATRASLERELQGRMDAETDLLHELADWIDAYNGCFASLQEYTEENARLQEEVRTLRGQMELMKSQVHFIPCLPLCVPLCFHTLLTLHAQIHPAHRFTLDALAPKNKQIRVLRKRLMRRNSDARSEDRRRELVVEDGRTEEAAESYETCSMYSPDE